MEKEFRILRFMNVYLLGSFSLEMYLLGSLSHKRNAICLPQQIAFFCALLASFHRSFASFSKYLLLCTQPRATVAVNHYGMACIRFLPEAQKFYEKRDNITMVI